jgi:hypothetical protein
MLVLEPNVPPTDAFQMFLPSTTYGLIERMVSDRFLLEVVEADNHRDVSQNAFS